MTSHAFDCQIQLLNDFNYSFWQLDRRFLNYHRRANLLTTAVSNLFAKSQANRCFRDFKEPQFELSPLFAALIFLR